MIFTLLIASTLAAQQKRSYASAVPAGTAPSIGEGGCEANMTEGEAVAEMRAYLDASETRSLQRTVCWRKPARRCFSSRTGWPIRIRRPEHGRNEVQHGSINKSSRRFADAIARRGEGRSRRRAYVSAPTIHRDRRRITLQQILHTRRAWATSSAGLPAAESEAARSATISTLSSRSRSSSSPGRATLFDAGYVLLGLVTKRSRHDLRRLRAHEDLHARA